MHAHVQAEAQAQAQHLAVQAQAHAQAQAQATSHASRLKKMSSLGEPSKLATACAALAGCTCSSYRVIPSQNCAWLESAVRWPKATRLSGISAQP